MGGDSGTNMSTDPTLSLLNTYKSQNDLELARLKPKIESLKSKISNNTSQAATRSEAVEEIMDKVRQLEEANNKTREVKEKEARKQEIKKLKEKRDQIDLDKKKFDNDIESDKNELNENTRSEKQCIEANKSLVALIDLHKQSLKESEASTSINHFSLLVNTLHRRFVEIQKMQLFTMMMNNSSLSAEEAYLKASQEIKMEEDRTQVEMDGNADSKRYDANIQKFSEMYMASLSILSLMNRFQFQQKIEAEERVLLSDRSVLREQLDPALPDRDKSNPLNINIEDLSSKIFNFKFTSKG